MLGNSLVGLMFGSVRKAGMLYRSTVSNNGKFVRNVASAFKKQWPQSLLSEVSKRGCSWWSRKNDDSPSGDKDAASLHAFHGSNPEASLAPQPHPLHTLSQVLSQHQSVIHPAFLRLAVLVAVLVRPKSLLLTLFQNTCIILYPFG